MTIKIDRTKCMSLGICESLAPDVLELDDNGQPALRAVTRPGEHRDQIVLAVSRCPMKALRWEG
ncbi:MULTISPECIES: ferredoxin [unclassified Rhodococcus (in: high G+C Gram-positive bacteria)]|uniref:ferredoxin n=1 Tax=unclassified Rhodococcus (in: high G+C Gram-positive bacteria) TaxID=192944 RepID=UPI00163B23A1|nr:MULTISPECIES: ferredoxin [unclassified Rhodococcus (in: high G+C Gram-positive bacteria)]MBC2637709.1 ferredoxin [Rhodococcus sp. 3A]MBC2897547.1 ferredoxin [Rhodococcus sp. 4CII]